MAKFRMGDASLSITRTSAGDGGDYITIQVKDGRTCLIHAEVGLEEFAYAVTGRVVKCKVRKPESEAPRDPTK